MRDKTQGSTSWLQYDTEGNLVARLEKTPGGTWLLIPEPGYPFVIEIKTGIVRLWDRKRHKPVEFAKGNEQPYGKARNILPILH